VARQKIKGISISSANAAGNANATSGYVLKADGSGGAAWSADSVAAGISSSADATAITIDSSERVMIGTTDAGYADYGDSLTLGDVDGGGGNAGMTIRSGTSSYGTFYFSDATGTAAGTYAGKMQYNHSNNSMIFGTNSTDKLEIESSGDVDIKAGNLYITGSNDRRIKLSDSGVAGVSDSNNTVHIRGDNDSLKLMAAGNGGLIYEENGTEHLSIASGGQLKFNAGFGSSGNAYGIRAWVNFDGNYSSDAVIEEDGNVSSVVDNAVGDYTINFSSNMPDGHYAVSGFGTAYASTNVVAGCIVGLHSSGVGTYIPTTKTASAVRVAFGFGNSAYLSDIRDGSIVIVR
tara:strand:- start:461 stop:1501 length:1041 start_codon:yes stop_codon:yes gene_type:complete